jgi:glycosyltransferase involved in cell wall biosynthesis
MTNIRRLPLGNDEELERIDIREKSIENRSPSRDQIRESLQQPRCDVPSPESVEGGGKRLLIVAPHVVQYSSPLFRKIAQQPGMTLLVAYCSLQGAESGIDPGFGVKISWDTAQLDDYPWIDVPNRALRPGTGKFWALFNPGLWNLIRRGRFDAVLVCGYYFASAWIAVCAAKLYGVPIIFVTDSHSLRSWRTQAAWKLQIKKQLVQRIFSLARAVIVSSTGGVEYMKSLGFPSERIVLTPTSVDNAWWLEQAAKADREAARAAWNIPAEGTVTLFCAKLQRWKGPMDLLEAFARANVPGSYLVFAGDGPERSNLEGRAAELGLADRVRFLGFVNQSQLPSTYCAADLFVLPSLFEPFGLVVNEAMLCGLPVVVSDRVGAKFDLVRPDDNGCVFPAGDVTALAAILRQILPDQEKRARMGVAARSRMETWSPREYVDSVVRAVDLVAKDEDGP